IYFVVMMAGAFGYRLPHPGWRPAGWTPPPDNHVTADAGSVPVDVAWRTPQFWFLWGVLCMNVTAGIGILGIASPMIQEIFKGRVTASAARCTAAGSRRSPRTSPTRSASGTSARFTDGC